MVSHPFLPESYTEQLVLAEKIATKLVAQYNFCSPDFFGMPECILTTRFIRYINKYFLSKLCKKYSIYSFSELNNIHNLDEYDIAAHLFLRIKVLQSYAMNPQPRNYSSEMTIADPDHDFSLYILNNIEKNQYIARKYQLPDIEIVLCDILKTLFHQSSFWKDLDKIQKIIEVSLTAEQQKESYLAILVNDIKTCNPPDDATFCVFYRKLIQEKFLNFLSKIPFDNDPNTIAIENVIKKIISFLPNAESDVITCYSVLQGRGRAVNFSLEKLATYGSEQQKAIKKILSFTSKKIDKELCDIFKMQMIRRVLYPHLIDQYGSVCGTSVFMQLFVKYHPSSYVKMVINLIENEKNTKPIFIKSLYDQDELKSIITIDQLILDSFRNQENILPYRTSFPDIIEQLSGVTFSYEISNWVNNIWSQKLRNALPFQVKDTTVHVDEHEESISQFKQRIFQIYSPNRIEFANLKENFLNTLEHFKQNHHLIMMINDPLSVLLYDGRDRTEEGSPWPNSYLFGIEYAHFINVNYLAMHGDIVEISGSTWGDHFHRTIDIETFLKGYRGTIIVNQNFQFNPKNSPTLFAQTLRESVNDSFDNRVDKLARPFDK